MSRCIGCTCLEVVELLDLGDQPPSNRFLRDPAEPEVRHPLKLGQCVRCGLLQLQDAMSPELTRARFPWISYNEPESHLDDMVEHLARMPGLDHSARVRGLTYKDDSTLRRFDALGFHETYRYDPKADFGISDPLAGLETVQAALSLEVVPRLQGRFPAADILVMRHVLEHAHDPRRFIASALSLVRPGGYLVVEVPDCRTFVSSCEYCFLWEEHVSYFSPVTLRGLFEGHGQEVAAMLDYPYPAENSLVAVIRAAAVPASASPPRASPGELADARRFGTQFEPRREACRAHFLELRRRKRRVAVFGASHLAVKFLNFFGLAGLVECVIDDNPDKAGLAMPGSRLPIVRSSILDDGGIDECLLSLAPESEARVLARRRPYVERGGTFRSIFSTSPVSFWPARAGTR